MRRPLHYIVSPAFLLLFLLAVSGAHAAPTPKVQYSVSIPDPAAETFHVAADIYGLKADTMTFFFPVWAPGAYDIVNFGAFVTKFTARQEKGGELKVIRTDTSTFKIVAPSDHIRLEYVVHDIENLPNSAWFSLSDIEDSAKVAFAVGTALFGYPAGHGDIPFTVTYTPPQGWDLAVALDPVSDRQNTFSAVNYDELVDAPVQMGKFQRYEFEVKGIPHVITMTAPVAIGQPTADELVAVTKTVVQIMTDFFGEIPYKRYLFQFYLKTPTRMDQGFGALEHANSSTYLMPYYGEDMIANMLQPVISHEFWHLWSPKRFHVEMLGPFDYQHGPRTTSLWFHEGLTEYYARALLVRNSQRSQLDFLQTFGSFIEDLYGASQREPITKLSAEITDRPLFDIISLYTKGPVLGLLLDGEIRLQTGNKKSLDDAILYFNRNYADHLKGKDFGDDDIIPIMEEATGTKLGDFYRRYIAGTEPLPFAEMLPKLGLRPILVPDLGLRPASAEQGWRIVSIYKNGMAEAGGLHKDDVITGIGIGSGEIRTIKETGTTASRLVQWLAEQIGENKTITIAFLRDGTRQTATLPVKWVCKGLGVDTAPAKEAKEIRQGMLGF